MLLIIILALLAKKKTIILICFLFHLTHFMLISLEKEAISVLRSCGWADEVYSFMRSRKRLCVEQVGTTRNGDEAK